MSIWSIDRGSCDLQAREREDSGQKDLLSECDPETPEKRDRLFIHEPMYVKRARIKQGAHQYEDQSVEADVGYAFADEECMKVDA